MRSKPAGKWKIAAPLALVALLLVALTIIVSFGFFAEEPLSSIQSNDVESIELSDGISADQPITLTDDEVESLSKVLPKVKGTRFLAGDSVRQIDGNTIFVRIRMGSSSTINLEVVNEYFSINGIWYEEDGNHPLTTMVSDLYTKGSIEGSIN